MPQSTTYRPRTLYDKIWDDHIVHTQEEDGRVLLYIDRHIVHEVTSPQAFEGLRLAGRIVRRPDITLATVDHGVPTGSRKGYSSLKTLISDQQARDQCVTMEENAKKYGIQFFGLKDKRQGISHVIAPEQGFTLPGITCVCGDSHTATHGAFGALAFGIGTSEVEHVLTTQTLLQKKSKNMRINVDGALPEGVTSKDVILHIIGQIGTAGATGCVIEYTGSVFRSLSMEARMSVCNMSIEAGARSGMIAPDETTFKYLKGRPLAPKPGYEWDEAEKYWRTLHTDEGAHFDVEININASDIAPTVTWGTSPQDVVAITGTVPSPEDFSDQIRQNGVKLSLKYMGLEPGTCMEDIPINKVFLGSCTNGRIEDIRAAAFVVIAAGPDARVPPTVDAMIVPGSGIVKEQAEAEGLDVILKRAGFDWREAGCSMCCGLNDDRLTPGLRCASTINRNFQGRQGSGGRTHLLSPAMAAAAALNGKLTDVRRYFRHKQDEIMPIGPQLTVTNGLDFVPEITQPSPPLSENKTAPDRFSVDNLTSSQISKFLVLKGIAAPLDIENVDTDMIIAVPFVKGLKRTGLGAHLFHTLRVNPHTGQKTDFVLNRPPYDRARIIVCIGSNFGCGSSREHAAWSLNDFGVRCVIAPSFAEIFENNCVKNGLLPITLPPEECASLHADAVAGLPLEVDLGRLEIRRVGDRPTVPFQVDTFQRHCLLEGLDDIALTALKLKHIENFEKRRSEKWPWLDGLGHPEGIELTTLSGKSAMEW